MSRKYKVPQEKLYRPLVTELGKLVVSWNALQQSLENLFSSIIDGSYGDLPAAIWHAVPSDRSQRDMLKAAAVFCKKHYPYEWSHPKKGITCKFPTGSWDRIEWLVTEANKLAEDRNAVIHSPYVLVKDGQDKTFKPSAHITSKNRKAIALSAKGDIIAELKWYRARSECLLKFSRDIWDSFWRNEPLPDIPLMPTRGQKTRHRSRTRRSRPK
jgi:hypothetical protein